MRNLKYHQPKELVEEASEGAISNALKKCLSEIQQPLPVEHVFVLDAFGRILREDLRSPYPIPPYSRSVMDGYAVRHNDLVGASEKNSVTLKVVGELPAGTSNGKKICPGEAIRIMTGAPLPEGADAVVMAEDTERAGNFVMVCRPVKRNKNISFMGEDVKQGHLILPRGVRIGPMELGLISACGKDRVPVSRRPKIGILSTGDELIAPGNAREDAQIYDVNGYALSGLVMQTGAEPVFLGIARDKYEDLLQALNRAGDLDVLLISGGISVGDYDIVQDVLLKAGIRKILWRDKINPGKSILVGRRFKQLIFSLPGNPVSSMLNFLLLVRPVLDKMMGRKTLGLKTGKAVILEGQRLRPGRKKFLHGRLEWIGPCLGVRILPRRQSEFHAMAAVDALVEVSEDIELLEKGDEVNIYHLGEAIKATFRG